MSTFNPTGLRSFTAGSALEAFRRVKLSSGTVVYAGAGDNDWIGNTEFAAASGSQVTVKMRNVPGTRKMISASSATAGARAFAAADGKVDDVVTGGPGIGTYLDSPSAAGIACEILPDSESDKAGTLAAILAASTAVAVAGPTVFSNGTKTIEAGSLKAGDRLRIKFAGTLTSTGSETCKVRALVGAEVVLDTGAVNPADSGDIFWGEVDVIVRVAGASGKLVPHGASALGTPGTVTAKPYASAEVSEDLSGAIAVAIDVTNSSTGESVVLQFFTVDIIRQ